MALIYFGDNRQRQELHSCPWQTNLENRQEIADYLIRRLQEKELLRRHMVYCTKFSRRKSSRLGKHRTIERDHNILSR